MPPRDPSNVFAVSQYTLFSAPLRIITHLIRNGEIINEHFFKYGFPVPFQCNSGFCRRVYANVIDTLIFFKIRNDRKKINVIFYALYFTNYFVSRRLTVISKRSNADLQ